MTAAKNLGIPVKLLHEAEGHPITIETTTGEVYRGYLADTEDSWNCRMSNATVTSKDGKTKALDQVYLRGTKIRYIIVPDMLKNAPIFKVVQTDTSARARINAAAAKRR
eukprot:NODE_2950_length_476_cov_38.065903_g2900_i0.p1 GENE.NODE_2950_length_476_cov_38.065903_g2900_i0~~NODE_2950_length_476_cov_38.065903_g2900_i0.p1  ORF type:complete len:109 (-),score=7.38 NODE_2950_length_476_cov_38.065903_g2900_i0:24-350(-)